MSAWGTLKHQLSSQGQQTFIPQKALVLRSLMKDSGKLPLAAVAVSHVVYTLMLGAYS